MVGDLVLKVGRDMMFVEFNVGGARWETGGSEIGKCCVDGG